MEDNDKDHPLLGGAEGSVLGNIKKKLIDTKEKWAAEGRGLSDEAKSGNPREESMVGHNSAGQNRLPPGQRLTKDWPVLDLGVQPAVPKDQWTFSASGLIENPISWSWDDFMAQPQVTLTTDIHCVTTWSRYDNIWDGVTAKQFLSVVKPKPEAKFLIFHSHDGYTTNVPLARFDDDDVMLAHRWNGEDIARGHGGPMRPVIPKLYLWKSAKWVKHVTFLDKDAPGFWEVRGYHNQGDPWKEERYGLPLGLNR